MGANEKAAATFHPVPLSQAVADVRRILEARRERGYQQRLVAMACEPDCTCQGKS